ncbi:MAG: glycosyltransferase family 2 protein [Spirochaetes bacterium]|nr:glycosyltransferase family 2 protein [Spirochaetota bacterium]
MKNKIDILLATYNGEQFIAEQLESILSQTYTNWQLIIRDDGSTDDTQKILKKYKKKYSEKIKLIKDKHQNLGSMLNFSVLMGESKADYIAFSDQDDVWEKDKLEVSMKAMQTAEKKNGKKSPLLVHTDMKVVDEELNEIHESFWKYQKHNPVKKGSEFLMVQNNTNGCTMLFNKELKDMAFPIPDEAIMHDWWVAIVASEFGKIVALENKTVLYRQHYSNRLGAKRINIISLIKKKWQRSFSDVIRQSKAFSKRFDVKIPNSLSLIFRKIWYNLKRI